MPCLLTPVPNLLAANVGQLYLLDSAFLFLEKPPMAFQYEDVLKITPNPSTGGVEVTTIGSGLVGRNKWYGGLLGGNGCIYGILINN